MRSARRGSLLSLSRSVAGMLSFCAQIFSSSASAGQFHQMMDVVVFIQPPNAVDNFCGLITVEDWGDKRQEFLFHLKILERILRVPERIIDALAHTATIGEIDVNNVCDRARIKRA